MKYSMTTNYENQAKDFLKETKTTLQVVEAVPQKSPIWSKEKHGINYSVTLKNSKHSYTFDFWGSVADAEKVALAIKAKEKGIYSPEYYAIKDWCRAESQPTVPNMLANRGHDVVAGLWLNNVIETVKILITPTAYDIFACLNPLYEDNFDDFCNAYGYKVDSITALKNYEVVKEQDYHLMKLFTREEMDKLAIIL